MNAKRSTIYNVKCQVAKRSITGSSKIFKNVAKNDNSYKTEYRQMKKKYSVVPDQMLPLFL